MATTGGPEKKGHKMKSKGYKGTSSSSGGAGSTAKKTTGGGSGTTGNNFTAVMKDNKGNVISRRSGTLAPSSKEEAFKNGGTTGGINLKEVTISNKKRRESPRGY